MTEFDDTRPIYRQIADTAYNRILEGMWLPSMLIPSIRELSAELGVNARTVLKAMEHLQEAGVISPRRGMGYILAPDAVERVRSLLRDEFFARTIPSFAAEMRRLGISPHDVEGFLYGN